MVPTGVDFQHDAETKRGLCIIFDSFFERRDLFAGQIQDVHHTPVIACSSIKVRAELRIILHQGGQSTPRWVIFIPQNVSGLGSYRLPGCFDRRVLSQANTTSKNLRSNLLLVYVASPYSWRVYACCSSSVGESSLTDAALNDATARSA